MMHTLGSIDRALADHLRRTCEEIATMTDQETTETMTGIRPARELCGRLLGCEPALGKRGVVDEAVSELLRQEKVIMSMRADIDRLTNFPETPTTPQTVDDVAKLIVELQCAADYAAGHGLEGISPVLARQAADALSTLQAIVSKLSLTADNVRVVPGMKLWRPPFVDPILDENDDPTGETEECPASRWQPVSNRMLWFGPSDSKYGSGGHDVTTYYSTREAAESAARAATREADREVGDE